MIRSGLLALWLLAGLTPAAAETVPTGEHEIAAAQRLLAEAEVALTSASGRTERRNALALAVKAHEAALLALRSGLRRLAETDRELSAALKADHDRVLAVVAALQSLARAPRSAVLLHPDGALAAARSASVFSELTPRLHEAIQVTARRIDTLRGLRVRQEIARAEARGALASLQALRAESGRSRGEARSRVAAAEDLRVQAAEAAARAQDLDDLAETLRASFGERGTAPFETRRGRLVPPVAGRISGTFGGVDPWGRTGQGVSITAPSYAEVRSPTAATVRYAGPLIDYGEVVILEPEAGWLIVLAGLAETHRRVGEAVVAGDPLGDLGGPLPSSEEFLLEASGAVPKIDSSDLYVEIRRDGVAIDPAPWFASTGE